MIGQMAIAIALPGFSGFGSSVTYIFLSVTHRFLCRFSTSGEKIRINLSIGSLIFCNMHH